MTATQQFIEDAIAGEYNGTPLVKRGSWCGINTWKHALITNDDQLHLMAMLLDPLAWEAVGKTRGWEHQSSYCRAGYHKSCSYGTGCDCFCKHLHRFIAYLVDGQKIDEALASL